MTAPGGPSSPDHMPSEEAVREEAAVWFGRLRSDTLSAADRQAFAAWQRQSPAHAQAFAAICALWEAPELTQALTEVARESAVRQPMVTRQRRYRWLALGAAAALVLLFLGWGVDLALMTRLRADYWTAVGTRQVIQLADGVAVTLNTASALAAEPHSTGDRWRLLQGGSLL